MGGERTDFFFYESTITIHTARVAEAGEVAQMRAIESKPPHLMRAAFEGNVTYPLAFILNVLAEIGIREPAMYFDFRSVVAERLTTGRLERAAGILNAEVRMPFGDSDITAPVAA